MNNLMFVSYTLEAQGSVQTVQSISAHLIEFVQEALIAPAFIIVFLVFVYSVARFIMDIQKGSTEISKEAYKRLFYPILAVFLLISLFSIIWILREIVINVSA